MGKPQKSGATEIVAPQCDRYSSHVAAWLEEQRHRAEAMFLIAKLLCGERAFVQKHLNSKPVARRREKLRAAINQELQKIRRAKNAH